MSSASISSSSAAGPQYLSGLSDLIPPETTVLVKASSAFVITVTIALLGLTLIYAGIAVKMHVNASSTVDALFMHLGEDTLKDFVIRKPSQQHPEQAVPGSRAASKAVQSLYAKIES